MDILTRRPRKFLIEAKSVTSDVPFNEFVAELIRDRIQYWKDQIAIEDTGDIERRGIVKGLNWVLSLDSMLEKAIKKEPYNA